MSDLATAADDQTHATRDRLGFVAQPMTVCGLLVRAVVAYDIYRLAPTCPVCAEANRVKPKEHA